MTFLLLITWLPAIVLLIVQIAFAGNFTFFRTKVFLVPGDHGVLRHRGRGRLDRDAGALVAVQEQPLRRHPVCGGDFLLVRHVRVLTAVTPEQRAVVDLVLGQSRAGRQRDLRQPLKYDTPWPVSLLILVGLVVLSAFVPRTAVADRGRRVTADPVRRGPPLNGTDRSSASTTSRSRCRGHHPPARTNGAGKSTFMKLDYGAAQTSKGGVTVSASRSGRTRRSHSHRLCPEQDAFYDRMTALEWVTALVRLNGVSESEAASLARRSLEAWS